MTRSDKSPKFGDIYLMNFTGNKNEQSGWRPGLVFQNNVGNEYSPNIIALPLTSSIKKTSQPTHIIIPARETGLLKDSMVLCENPERMSKDRIGAFITELPVKYLTQIAMASLLASAAICLIEPEKLLELRQKALELNTNI